jgi:hypothetical protein
MKWFLFAFAAALTVLAFHQEQDLETAHADLERAHEQIGNLEQRLAQVRRIQPEFFAPTPAPAGAPASATPAPTGQWMWAKRSSALDAATTLGDQGSQPGRKGAH